VSRADSPAGVHVVLLDIDDTLVDTRGAFRGALFVLLGTWLPHLDAEAREAALLRWAQDPGGHFRAYTRGEIDMESQRRARIVDLHAAFGGPELSRAELADWSARYEALIQELWRLTPDALDLLDALDAAGIRVGAVTNSHRDYQVAKLTRVGLATRLPVVSCLDDLGYGKPRAEIYHHACRLLGVTPERAAYVGDELDIDARGARDAGLLGIWLDRHGSGLEPGDVAVVRTLAEVPRLLGLSRNGATPAGTDLGENQAAR